MTRRKMQKWGAREDAVLREMWADGSYTATDIGKRLGYTYDTIRSHVRRLDLPRSDRSIAASASAARIALMRSALGGEVTEDLGRVSRAFERAYVAVARRRGWRVHSYAKEASDGGR